MHRYLAVCCLALATLAGSHIAAAGPPRKVASIEGITEYRLDNGLQLLLYPDATKPTVTVNLTLLVGSRHEGYGETGMAHLLEHMLFKGTPTNPNVPKVLQERGARFNGTTWLDRTNYFETLPASGDNLEFAIKLESDRMINSYVRQEDLFSEMTVVRNEFEMGENSPEMLLDQRIMAVAFDWHNYGKSTIGNRSDIERVPIAKLKEFYVKYYQPDNAMLVIAGKFDEAKAVALVAEHFGTIPRPKRKLDRTYTDEPPQDGERTVTLRRRGDVSIASAAYHIPAGAHPDSAALEVLGGVLEDAPSGWLYKALVETKKATDVSAGAATWHDAGVFQVGAQVRRDSSLEQARDTMLEVTESVARKGVSSQEVDRAKLRILKRRELAAADTGRIAVDLSEWAAQGDWRLYLLHRDRIEKVTPKDVQEVAAKYFTRNNRTVGMFIASGKAERTPVPERPDLAKLLRGYRGRSEDVAGEAFDVAPLAVEARVQRSVLPENVKVALLPKKTRGQAVHARLTLRYGTTESLRGYETACDLLPHVMLRGTKRLSRQEIQDELDRLRATISASGDTGVVTFSIETKRDKLPAVLDLLRQIVREPSLPATEFEVLRLQQIAELEETLTDPHSLAMVRLRRTVSPFPADDVRYVPTVEEEVARAKAAKIDQLRTLHADYLGSQAGEVAIVGDFDAAQATAKLTGMLAEWKAGKPYERIPRVVFPEVRGGTQQIVTPDKANAVYTAGLVFPLKDSDPNYAPMVIGNYVFGAASLSSRLAERVRGKEGLSYGVGSMFGAEALDRRASLTMLEIGNPENVKKVDASIADELAKWVERGITDDELRNAKRGYLEQQQVSRSSDSRLASLLSDTLYAGRTMQYYADMEKQVQALKTDDVNSIIKKYVDPQRLTIILAGDFPKATAERGSSTGALKRK